jgi:phenylacetate-coenzyme A ligase PaaK-like adenylate-forming protein
MNKILLHALDNGMDFVSSLPVVLAKIGDDLGNLSGEFKSYLKWHPLAAIRIFKAIIKSKMKKHPVLPKDIWKVKGIICGGTDFSFYREKIYTAWGINPLDIYLSTETGFMAMQGWNKKGLTFLPYSQFYEFIPEKELIKSENDKEYRPATVLFNELETNNVYELVVTNFHGGPFLRYRIGDLIKVVSTQDDEMRVNLPQIRFFNRTNPI